MTKTMTITTAHWCIALLLAITLMMVSQKAYAQQQIIPLSDNDKDNLMVTVDNVLLTWCGEDSLGFSMSFAMLGNSLPRQHRAYIVPQLIMGEHTASFPAIEIMGNWAYYHDIRTPLDTLHVPDTLQYRDRDVRTYQAYQQTVPREYWMGIALLRLLVLRVDGCGNEVSRVERVLRVPTPIVNEEKEEDIRKENIQQLQGRAYVSFPVNRTEVNPNFRNNKFELERLRHTIDSVSNDTTIEILRIQIKGFASPEGTYQSNDRLARERTSSLTRYIIENTAVSPVLFHTAYEAEDWEGMRNFVDTASTIVNRKALLDIIDTEMDPDEKLNKIGYGYPDDFRTLAAEAFPLLRHTEYQIDYQLRDYTIEKGEVKADTLYLLITDTLSETLVTTKRRFNKGYKPRFAVKTNMLYDLALAPNVEIEVPLGRNKQYSVMAEYTNPWFRLDKLNYSYEIQEAGVEFRRWFAPRCSGSRPWLCGTFLGLYAASLKYDLEYNGTGNQGELISIGLSLGYSWPVSSRLNLEFSLAAGAALGNRRHYNAEFESSHLIYKYTKDMSYIGPTKLKFSLVWIIPSPEDNKKTKRKR